MDDGAARPLRVWLEPDYDGGRYGAWLLDVPGAFGWSTTRERALQGSLSVAGRVREWLADHGDAGVLPAMRGIEVVEEVPATRGPDGTERNATFAADHRSVPPDELEAVLRRLAYARADLGALLARVDAFEAERGPLPTDGLREERTSDDVLRHLAASEAWLTSRLDSDLRFGGLDRGDRRSELDDVRAWMEARIRELHQRDPAIERVDSKGESWTLAKVLRRLVYHALDHLWELDRRLARVDGSAEQVVVTLDRRPTVDQLVSLVRAVGWDPRAEHPDRLMHAQVGTPDVVGAWDGDRLVGYARSQNDRAMTAYVSMVIVHPRWQALGIGRRIMETLMAGHDRVRFALSAAPGMNDWYARLGFEPDPRAMVRRRREDPPAR
jgi:GNAT superfamily N-acetyltransferase